MKIEDDGVGFDPATIGEGGVGFKTMQERAALINARLEIGGHPAGGAFILVEVSL
jgi:signal transduction histidine kinase